MRWSVLVLSVALMGCGDNSPVVVSGQDAAGPFLPPDGGSVWPLVDGGDRDVWIPSLPDGGSPPWPDGWLPPAGDVAGPLEEDVQNPWERQDLPLIAMDALMPDHQGPWPCLDGDGDGYGEGQGCLGPDCDDLDPLVHQGCAPNCASPQPGCPCTDPAPCYEGPPGTQGVGLCTGGTMICQGGTLSDCQGQTLPSLEICNGLDDDCDGQADEDGVDPCGDCSPGCQAQAIGGEGQEPLAEEGSLDGLSPRPDGALQLSSESITYGFVWIANTDESTVSKLDAQTGHEVGRYYSHMVHTRDRSPSRTAVDLNGDMFVANRAFELQGSVTKIGGNLTSCVDRDGDGLITTSHDADGNGRINISDPTEFPGLDDECLLFSVDLGSVNGLPRAVAICEGYYHGGGTVWVGVYNDRRMFAIDNEDGHILHEVDVTLTPYGAVCDSMGTLWVTQRSGDHITGINTATLETHDHYILSDMPDGCVDTYGIGLDNQGRVWINGRECSGAFRYDPKDDSWMTVYMRGFGIGRGIAGDSEGRVWATSSYSQDWATTWAHVASFDSNTGRDITLYEIPGSDHSVGVAMDFFGKIWTVNLSSNDASRIDPETGDIDSFPVGAGPYTYSDFTGFSLRTFTAPRGTYTTTFTGCEQGETEWRSLSWEASLPQGTSVRARYHSAQTQIALSQTPWSDAMAPSPIDLTGQASGRLLEVEVILESLDEASSPLLQALEAVYVCD